MFKILLLHYSIRGFILSVNLSLEKSGTGKPETESLHYWNTLDRNCRKREYDEIKYQELAKLIIRHTNKQRSNHVC